MDIFAVKQVGIMCTMSSASNQLGIQILAFTVSKLLPNIIGTILTLIYYVLSIKQIRRIQRFSSEESNLKAENLFLYPIILFAIFLPSNVDNFLRLCLGMKRNTTTQAIKVLITHSLGLINAIVYGFQEKECE